MFMISWRPRLVSSNKFLAFVRRLTMIEQMKQCFDRKQYQELLQLFDEHTKRGPITQLPSQMIVKVLQSVAKLQDPSRAIAIHRAIPSDLIDNPYVLSSLVHMYMQCGDVTTAEHLFDRCQKKSMQLYGAMMKGYVKNDRPLQALSLFEKIPQPDQVIFTILFNACAKIQSSDALILVKNVSSKMPRSCLDDRTLMASLIDALMKCGDVSSAESYFHPIEKKSIQMYGAMMKGFIQNEQPKKAIDLFQMIEKPDEIIFLLLFNACAQVGSPDLLHTVKAATSSISNDFCTNALLTTSLIDALMKCGDVPSAEVYFNQAKTRNSAMHGAMMKGYIKNNQPKKAIEVFHRIRHSNVVLYILLFNACAKIADDQALALVKKHSSNLPTAWMTNVRLTTSLMDALIKCGDCESAEKIFPQTERSVTGYGNLMNGFNDAKQPEKTLALYEELKTTGIVANRVIFLLVIKALSQVKIGQIANGIINEIPQHILQDLSIQSSLISMWAKIGVIHRAKRMFEEIDQPDEYLFSTMIHGYGMHGMGSEALEVFDRMPRHLINEVTYVCILTACSHSGFVDKAQEIFNQIEEKSARIYTTMVDCLSRAALFDRAETLINEFESVHPPDHAMHLALLSSARNHKNIHLAERIFTRIAEVFPHVRQVITSATVLLGNIYGSMGDTIKASDLRSDLSQSGAKKVVGASWTAPDGQLAKFRAHDRSHPRSTEIYAELERMSQELLVHGHRYDQSYVTRMLREDETIESVLCGHSEKLAIAWNFVLNPHAKRIEVSKNLRVCPDCHSATKRLALIRKCEFIINDANRLHHVTADGRCSCGDYF